MTRPDVPDNLLGDWLEWYRLAYDAASRRARRRRAEKREADRLRRASAPGPKMTAEQRVKKDAVLGRHESRRAAVDARWRHGFVWTGGAVGGTPRYYVGPTTYRGLVSDEHPILKAFAARVPRAGFGLDRLQTGRTKEDASQGDSKVLALDSPYVTATRQMRGLIRIDLDADFPSGWREILTACSRCGVLPPNLIVGHVRRRDGAVLHPHLLYLLDAPVAFTPRARRGPQALWYGVSRGLTAALLPVGADPGGLANALRAKNPLCPVWGRLVAAERPYRLADLARHVRLDVTDDELAMGRPASLARSPDQIIDPETASNALFVSLRAFAREHVGARRANDVSIDEWVHELVTLALTMTDNERRGHAVASSVARYTWHRSAPRERLNEAEVRDRRQAAGRRTAADRRLEGEDAIAAAYRAISAEGRKATQAAVQTACGLSLSTIKRRWRSVINLASESNRSPDVGVIRSPFDKKGGEAGALATAETRKAIVTETAPREVDGQFRAISKAPSDLDALGK